MHKSSPILLGSVAGGVAAGFVGYWCMTLPPKDVPWWGGCIESVAGVSARALGILFGSGTEWDGIQFFVPFFLFYCIVLGALVVPFLSLAAWLARRWKRRAKA